MTMKRFVAFLVVIIFLITSTGENGFKIITHEETKKERKMKIKRKFASERKKIKQIRSEIMRRVI